MILGYTRVSKSEEQNAALQRQALQDAGVERIFHENASGARWDRPELRRAMDQLRPGDVLVVWKLDRLSRSLKDLLLLLERMDQTGAGFRSLTEAIDTTTPAGRMMMQMVGAFAEFGDGLEGLIHVSQLSSKKVSNPEIAVKVDDKIKAKIIKVDTNEKKIALSIKASEENLDLEAIENEQAQLEHFSKKKD